MSDATYESAWFLYIVQCSDDSLYTGIAKNVERRVKRHNSGNGAKSIKGKLPVTLVYHEQHQNFASAAKREREVKKWKRDQKLKLINGKKRL